ncbi:MAG TPA: hypothetical protein VKZ18_12415, partial [Polyangia bacterium]|nr:hypothetical protein [Polyangia bacterium]
GILTNDQFVRVIDEMARAASGDNQLRFGDVAVGLGFLTPVEVERGLGEQVCGIISRSLQREESRWTFDPSPPAPRPPRAFFLEINPAVTEALRSAPDLAAVAEMVAARPDELVVVAGARPAPEARSEKGGPGGQAHAARVTAEQAFQKGLGLLREGKTVFAAIELRRASELQPDSLEYLLYATWAKARSHRDVPGELDQQALLDLAQRAKRRDPMFAFASYVIGQLSMWAGDDATAKKWFYEALRLDPASEAGKQVRILARRGGGAPAPSGGAAPAEPAKPVEVAAPVAPAPPAAARPQRPAATPPVRGGGVGRLVVGAALVAIAALAFVALRRHPAPDAGPAASFVPVPAAAIDAAAAVDAADHDAAAAAPPAEADDADNGIVVFPARATGHRIFVDGRRAHTEETDDGIAPLRLRCGSHEIQIGSGGTPETIEVPCGGRVQIQ